MNKLWWLNEESEQVLNRGYLLKGETVQGAIERVATAASKRLFKPELKDSFIELVENGWMSLSSPVWANMGTERGLPISCFNVHVPDSVEDITHKLGEVIMQTKIGGGTSGYFGELRGRGSAITDNGKSSGAVSFMKLFDTAMDTISQGGVRRGAFAAYLDIDHPDILEFLAIKDIGSKLQNLFFAVCIPDYWMLEMIEGDSVKREVWAKVLESRQQKGLPYIFFTDNVNKNKPQVYKDKGMQINASNLCVAPYTQILTDEGYKTIKNLEGKNVNVWNGEEWSNVQVVKTGENQKLIKIGFSNGKFIECTEYHNFYIRTNYKKLVNYSNPEDEWKNDINEKVKARELKVGDLIQRFVLEDNEIQDISVTSIEDNNKYDDTYCFTEPKRNMGVFNGILTGNCSEIALPSSKEESFVCCLSSMNLELYDEWKDTDAVKTAIYFLDAVMQEFIEKTKNNHFLRSAHNFAKNHRALGLGVMGWHSYLQKNMIPFEGLQAMFLTSDIFSHIRKEADKATRELASIYGEPPVLKDYGVRNTTLLAIAPTTSSSAILGQASPGIEPFSSNYFKAGLAKGNFIRKNKYLTALLEEKGINNEETWRSIMLNNGSVQQLDELTDKEKKVFKTFKEISQLEIIQQASSRQKHIDQAQSLNINIPSELPIKEVNKLIIEAWKLGVKTLYYQRSQSVSKEFITNLVSCNSCES